MQLLIIGHSYVRDLSQLRNTPFVACGQTINVEVIWKNGGTYDLFLGDSDVFERVSNLSADLILVILAGNSIKRSVANKDIFESASKFYTRLRTAAPQAKLVAAQVEPRYYQEGNKWDCPVGREFHVRRVQVNNFLKAFKGKDHIFQVSGPGRLDNSSLFKDSVHLSRRGLLRYFSMIEKLVRYTIEGPKPKSN